MPPKHPFSLRVRTQRFRSTSPGEDLWLALRDLYISSSQNAYPTLELINLPSWLEPAGTFAEHHIDVAVTTATYRLMKIAKRTQKEACLDGTILRDHEGQVLVEDAVARYMVEYMEFAALDPTPRRIVPHLVYRSLVAANADISYHARHTSLNEAEIVEDATIACYCCGDTLWSRLFETPRKNVALDHVWPRSLGGVSTADNLLPVCEGCNGAKEDRASWGVFGVVYDYALADRGTDANLMLSLALHRCAAGALAVARYITLKEAFVELGPRTALELIDENADKHFFNLRAHDTLKLPSVW